MSSLEEKDCITRTLYAGGSGLAAGSLAGAIKANWQDVPKVIRNKSLPALIETGRVMGHTAGIFGTIGVTFAAADCAAQSYRGKHDAWNGVIGGLAAGGVLGLRSSNMSAGIGAGIIFALCSAIVDATGQRLTNDGIYEADDGTEKSRYFPPLPKTSSS